MHATNHGLGTSRMQPHTLECSPDMNHTRKHEIRGKKRINNRDFWAHWTDKKEQQGRENKEEMQSAEKPTNLINLNELFNSTVTAHGNEQKTNRKK